MGEKFTIPGKRFMHDSYQIDFQEEHAILLHLKHAQFVPYYKVVHVVLLQREVAYFLHFDVMHGKQKLF